jgi:uncharacterized protein YkwD
MPFFRRPRRAHRALAVTAALTATAALAPATAGAATDAAARAAQSACPAAALQPTTPPAAQAAASTTLCLINRERTRRGLRRLRANAALSRSASAYSREMARRDFFSHVSPGGGTMLQRIRRAGYLGGARGYAVGENLAWGSGSYASPLRTVRGWMRSPGHRANILSRRYTEIGVGIAAGAPIRMRSRTPAATYTTHFGARR